MGVDFTVRAPVVAIPLAIQAWSVGGGRHAYVVDGAGDLERSPAALQVLGMQGAGSFGGEFVSRRQDVEAILGRGSSIGDVLALMAGASGSLALQLYDVDAAAVYLLNDPLGGGGRSTRTKKARCGPMAVISPASFP